MFSSELLNVVVISFTNFSDICFTGILSIKLGINITFVLFTNSFNSSEVKSGAALTSFLSRLIPIITISPFSSLYSKLCASASTSIVVFPFIWPITAVLSNSSFTVAYKLYSLDFVVS